MMVFVVAAVFVIAMYNKWELTALVFGIILLTYACNYDPNPNKIDSMQEWTTTQ